MIFHLSRDVERLIRVGFISFKLCTCQGLALLLCSQVQLDLSLALLFFPLLFSPLASILYVHFGFPVVSAPGDCPELRGSIKDILKHVIHLSVCECALAQVCHSARIGIRELVKLGSLLLLCMFWDETWVVGL